MKTSSPPRRLLHTGQHSYDHTDLDDESVFFAKALRAKQCPCCAIPLTKFEHELSTKAPEPGNAVDRWLCLDICLSCGWWHFNRDLESALEDTTGRTVRATWWELTHALQIEINISEDSLPVEDLRRYLLRKWDDRKLISAQGAEDLVSSLLKDHLGGEVHRSTANANASDGGIDLYTVFSSNGSIRRAIQVKRRISGDVEAVTDVRNFVGAMVLEDFDQGIFVTTASRFSKPAKQIPEKAKRSKARLSLDLIDGQELYEILAASSAAAEAQVPALVAADQLWKHSNGTIVRADQLFRGDLSQIVEG